jgi:hypothetical protein
MTSNPAVIATPFLFLLLLQFAVAGANCVSYGGPPIFEYDNETLVTYRDVPRNLTAGWRQTNLQVSLNSTVMSKNIKQ